MRDAVAFYATRDSDPGRWYPKRADGSFDKFNDLPKSYWANLNTDPPFDAKPGNPQGKYWEIKKVADWIPVLSVDDPRLTTYIKSAGWEGGDIHSLLEMLSEVSRLRMVMAVVSDYRKYKQLISIIPSILA